MSKLDSTVHMITATCVEAIRRLNHAKRASLLTVMMQTSESQASINEFGISILMKERNSSSINKHIFRDASGTIIGQPSSKLR
jgi:hypothetical protein